VKNSKFSIHQVASITVGKTEFLCNNAYTGGKTYTTDIKIVDTDGNQMEITLFSSDETPLDVKVAASHLAELVA
jgi:hypothetical protein